MSAIASGSSMSLFDRVADADAGADGDASLPLADTLRASIARDLARLLNTRSRLTFDLFAQREGTVLDYGVPDFTERSLQSGADRDAIAAAVARAIALFEPRLANVSVGFTGTSGGTSAADPKRHAPCLTIRGEMRAGTAVHHVAFELARDAAGTTDARWEAHG
ncbi:type VI secretion system baseplate subunit TssE [Paraburkholderia rhizosphaerae]|uniref:Type VI secretion system protein ImpF n=1 Tax=Paraburkholderia rhizosphaerae TaxID=480658 RepID=A0A4R8LV68_9BURK|nr:type VI secretion system baseplate subunit TssE [Paraburkholderia rhizosphaerae]TDY51468.1 type VI secretion system protein ImpF [Paraburkholderia rhizosphaerae]